MFYCYILHSKKAHKFYFGYAKDLKKRLAEHNNRQVFSTNPYAPWKLSWYCAFETEKEAKDFEKYLKSGSGKSFAYKRLISNALKKDFSSGRSGSPKRSA